MTDGQTYTTEIIYHASSRVVNKANYLFYSDNIIVSNTDYMRGGQRHRAKFAVYSLRDDDDYDHHQHYVNDHNCNTESSSFS